MIVRRESRTKAIVVAAFSLLVMVPAAIGFVGKLVDFFRTLTSEAGGGMPSDPSDSCCASARYAGCVIGRLYTGA